MQLWRKAATDIWASNLPMKKKLDLILCYFGIRKFATHWVSLGFFCMLVPLSIFTPEVGSWPWTPLALLRHRERSRAASIAVAAAAALSSRLPHPL